MAEDTVDSSQHRVLRLPLRMWLIAMVAFVVGFAITAALWTIVAGRDVQTMLTLLQTVLTFLTLVAAVVALWYAAESARAALATIKPMETMAANLATAAATLKDMQDSMATPAQTMKQNLLLAERGRREDRLVHRLGQYERIFAAVGSMQQALGRSDTEMRVGQAALRAALAPLPRNELPKSRDASTATVTSSHMANAGMEIEQVLIDTRTELDDLLKSAGP